jgi:hypothetical protein
MSDHSAAHADLKRRILLAIGALDGVRVTGRTSVGQAKTENGEHVAFGLWVGLADVVGIVAPYGRWLALEVKTGNARPNADQKRFLAMIRGWGGIAEVVRSVDDALAALRRAQQAPARAA